MKIAPLFGLIFLAFQVPAEAQTKVAKPRNIILLIGDGMGVSQIYAGYTVSRGVLNLNQFKSIGFISTHSATDYITDSGAGGTALATGKKTYNGAIGVDADTIPVASILELAEDRNMSTGLVSTSAITHATPASFIAHQASRNNYEQIAADFLKTDIDVFIGGGYNHFAKRSDQVNLLNELRSKGYQVVTRSDSVPLITRGKLAALTAPEHHPSILQGRGNMLPEATSTAIRLLSQNRKGFFLMVEGSQIDWGGHANNADYVVSEMLDFDAAIGKALEFAMADGNTLVIVTADHETGGMSLVGGDLSNGSLTAKFTSADHTGVMVPVFAWGPGASSFQGIQDNTDIFEKMSQLLGL